MARRKVRKGMQGPKYFLYVASASGISAAARNALGRLTERTKKGEAIRVEFERDTDREWTGEGVFGLNASIALGADSFIRVAVLCTVSGRIRIMECRKGEHGYDEFRDGEYSRLGTFADTLPEKAIAGALARNVIDAIRDLRTAACKELDGLPVAPKSLADCRVLMVPKADADD